MLKDTDTPRNAVRRTKRTYSAETKAELLGACNVQGASIAPVASANGRSVNVLRRWLKASSQSRKSIDTSDTATDVVGPGVASFIALPLLTNPAAPVEREIKVVSKGGLLLTFSEKWGLLGSVNLHQDIYPHSVYVGSRRAMAGRSGWTPATKPASA
jgi:transposase-like protein